MVTILAMLFDFGFTHVNLDLIMHILDNMGRPFLLTSEYMQVLIGKVSSNVKFNNLKFSYSSDKNLFKTIENNDDIWFTIWKLVLKTKGNKKISLFFETFC